METTLLEEEMVSRTQVEVVILEEEEGLEIEEEGLKEEEEETKDQTLAMVHLGSVEPLMYQRLMKRMSRNNFLNG